ncbi:hypothetical protein LCGC14_0259340 [marine sediment metagenome]|uniref:Uncharacterized protein n=1 Tax=marine sediment metagenome TaxID=412755 RepID=A0A0F9U798_9ZZZZ
MPYDEDLECCVPAYLLSFRCACGKRWAMEVEIPVEDWPPAKSDPTRHGARCACGRWMEWKGGKFTVSDEPTDAWGRPNA